MKHYIVALNSPTIEQRNKVSSFLNNTELFGYWHWIPDVWLLYSDTPGMNATFIRNEIVKVAPGLWFGVFSVTPHSADWGMFSDPKWADWIYQNWKV